VAGVPPIFTQIATILAPIAPVFASISHVFDTIAARALVGSGRSGQARQERDEHE
jgi:hypothetical protein